MQMINADGRQNYLYVYDLPKDVATSTKLATYLQDKTGIVLSRIPQIRRDINRPFYSAIMTIPEEDKFQIACKELRYFELAEDKPSRALPYDNDLLGSNPQKIVDHNIFVRKIPKNLAPKELEEHFSQYGEIKSLKVSLNSDHTSRGYGFVCFQEPASAEAALLATSEAETNQAIKYQPRDKRDFRRIYNNIYAKNFPPEFTEADVRKVFEEYGRVESLVYSQNEKGSYAFVCYNSDDKNNRQYGPECAERAVLELHNADQVTGCDGKTVQLNDKKLYVKEALKKSDREAERLRDTIKYKNSKKRCNLYVKGFPENCTEEDLRHAFEEFGEIESLRLHPTDKEKKLYAFVCFKKPDEASSAKEKLHNTQMKEKTLTINHYEIKEIRQLQNEATEDKRGFQQFRQANTQSAKWTDLANQEELQYYLKLLIESMPFLMKQQRPMGPGQGGQNMGYKKPGPRDGPGGYKGPRNQYGQQHQGQNRMMQGGGGMGHPQMGMQPQMGMPQGPTNNQQNMMAMRAVQDQIQAQNPQVQQQTTLTIDQRYIMTANQILPAIVPENPNYKDQVGTVLYEFVNQLVGQKAPKITGMLIDLPINDIQLIMQNYDLFKTRVGQANDLLAQQTGQATPQQ